MKKSRQFLNLTATTLFLSLTPSLLPKIDLVNLVQAQTVEERETNTPIILWGENFFNYELEDRAKTLQVLGDHYLWQRQYEQAFTFHQEAINIYRELGNQEKVADVLQDLGLSYLVAGQSEQAFTFHQEAINIYRDLGTQEILADTLRVLGDLAKTLQKLGDNYLWRGGQYEQAFTFHQEAINIYRELGNQEILADTLRALGEHYFFSEQQDEEGLRYIQEAINIYRDLGTQEKLADTLRALGWCYFNRQQYEQGLTFYQEAINIYRDLGNQEKVADTLRVLGWRYFETEQYQQAFTSYQEALMIYRQSGNWIQEVNILDKLGLYYFIKDQYKQALNYYQEAINIYTTNYEEILEFESEFQFAPIFTYQTIPQSAPIFTYQTIPHNYTPQFNLSSAFNSVGMIYQKQGNYDQSLNNYQQALEVAQKDKDQKAIASSLNNLAIVYQILGQYQTAIDYYQQASAIFQTIYKQDHLSATFNNLGIMYQILGQYEIARNYYQQSLTINQQLNNQSAISSSYNNLGLLAQKLEDYDIAINYYQQSLAINEQLKDQSAIAISYNNLGLVYQFLGDNEQALDYYQKSLALAQEIEAIPLIASSFNSLGEVYRHLGKYEESINYYQQSLALAQQIGDLNLEAENYKNIAQLLTQQNQPTTAIIFYKKAVNLYQEIRQNIQTLPPEQQESYLTTVEESYRNLADLLLEQGRILEAQQVLELLKLQEITNYTRDSNTRGKNDDKIVNNNRENEILERHGTFIALGIRIIDCEENNCAEYNQLLDDQEIIAEEFENLVKEIEIPNQNNDLELIELERLQEISDEIISAQPKTVLIYPVVLPDKIWILFVSKGGITGKIKVDTVGRKKLSETIENFRELLSSSYSDINELKIVSKQLYDWLIPPELVKELEDNKIENLVFSLDSVTRYIPLDVLFDGKEYLLQKYNISTIISAGLTDLDQTFPENPRILAAGLSNAEAGFNALPNVPLELDTIVINSASDPTGIYQGLSLLNQEFTADTIRNNLSQYNILHLATHAKFVPGNNYQSFLLLGNGEQYPIPNIEKLRGLGTIHLVVLSACETALGGEGNNGTEIAGISYYFLKGGADTVIASLWEVDDQSTRLLMELFYQNLSNGMDKASALRQAKLSLMKQDQQLINNINRGLRWQGVETREMNPQTTGFEHPYYWSPFILIGNRL